MRRWVGLAVMLLAVCAASAADDKKDPLAPGMNVPGTFHPYNVNVAIPLSEEPDDGKGVVKTKYTTRGKYHCLVTEYNLDPVVMLVARGLDDNKAFLGFLQKLHTLLDRNRDVRLRGFVVFLFDDLDDVLRDDREGDKDRKDERYLKREEAIKKVEKVADLLKRTQVVLTVAAKKDLAKYGLDDTSALTAILYKNLKIAATHRLSREKIAEDSPELKAILSDVVSKLGAKP